MEFVPPNAFVVQPEAALSLAHALLNASPSPLLLLDADLRGGAGDALVLRRLRHVP